jgi:hypothetical protein
LGKRIWPPWVWPERGQRDIVYHRLIKLIRIMRQQEMRFAVLGEKRCQSGLP